MVCPRTSDLKSEDPLVEVLYDRAYYNFLEEVDAVDNGISDRDGASRYAGFCVLKIANFAKR